MRKRYILNLLVFTFAVMIVLLRPFCVYHLANSPNFPKEPGKITRLLQSLIKKKNDHTADAEDVIELKAAKKYLPLPADFLVLFNKLLWLLSLLFGLSLLKRRTLFHVSPSNACYQFICRFQI